MARLYKRYKKTFDYSYAYGVYPTLELLNANPHHVIEVLLHTKGEPNAGVQKIITFCDTHHIRWAWNDKAIERIASKENLYAIGVFKKYAQTLEQQAPHLILVSPSSTGNLGTIIRTMLGFDFYSLAVIRPAADIFNPATVRSSMGGVFKIKFEYFDNFTAYLNKYPRPLYLLSGNGQDLLNQVQFPEVCGLVFGNEGQGLPENILNFGKTISIPQSKNIDSFNLAIAVGITLYHFRLSSN